MNAGFKVLYWFVIAWVVGYIIYLLYKHKQAAAAPAAAGSSGGAGFTIPLSYGMPATGGGDAGTTITPVGATFTQAKNAVITAIDKAIYGPGSSTGWGQYSDAAYNADQAAGGPHRFGKLEEEWEIVKWRVSNRDGTPVAQLINDYSHVDSSGRIYINRFGTNWYYNYGQQDITDILNQFVTNWKHYANYKPPTDGQVALYAVKIITAMGVVAVATVGTVGAGTAPAISFALLAASY